MRLRLDLLAPILATTILYLAGAISGSAFASPVTFNVHWSGASYGNSATATGFVTFDSAALTNTGVGGPFGINLPDPAVLDLGITVTGAGAGSGTFGLSDYDFVTFYAPSALDLTTELIGQTLSGGCTFGISPNTGPCANGNSGEFAFFAIGGLGAAPSSLDYFNLSTVDGQTLYQMLVTSVRTVPEPATIALFGIGLAGLGLSRRRKRA